VCLLTAAEHTMREPFIIYRSNVKFPKIPDQDGDPDYHPNLIVSSWFGLVFA